MEGGRGEAKMIYAPSTRNPHAATDSTNTDSLLQHLLFLAEGYWNVNLWCSIGYVAQKVFNSLFVLSTANMHNNFLCAFTCWMLTYYTEHLILLGKVL